MTVDQLEQWEIDAQWFGGDWVQGTVDAADPVLDPATGRVLGTVARAGVAEVRAAVGAARAAFLGWSATAPAGRAAAVADWLALIDADADQLARLLRTEVGTPAKACRNVQVGLALDIARGALTAFANLDLEQHVGNSVVRHLPVGVVAAITPWNVPMLLALQKIVPALLVGCTVVLKPSELTPLHAVHLARLAQRSAIPDGVLNIVFGDGPGTGAALAASPEIDLVSFTGSVRAGRSVAAAAADNVTAAHLELGGKSASLVLDDADLSLAVAASIDQAFFNSGQACLQWGRLVVPRRSLTAAEALARDIVAEYTVGDPADESTDIGPLISSAAKERVLGVLGRAERDGARVVVGGPSDAAVFHGPGNFVPPTVFADVDETSSLARDEIFGPVVCLMAHDGDADAARIANATEYGLHGAVWSMCPDRAAAVAREVRSGQIEINGGGFNPVAPFGGFKHSGIGRECGAQGLLAFTQSQSLQFPIRPGDGLAVRSVGSRAGAIA